MIAVITLQVSLAADTVTAQTTFAKNPLSVFIFSFVCQFGEVRVQRIAFHNTAFYFAPSSKVVFI